MTEATAPTPEVLEAVQRDFSGQLADAGRDVDALQKLRSTFFGPKGRLTLLLKSVGKLPPEARRDAGRMTNEVKRSLEGALVEVLDATAAEAREQELRRGRLDMSLPGRRARPKGSLHAVTQINHEMVDIFARMGFEVAGGPEVETDWHNFGALNFPDDHPARDMQDTFFVRPPDDRPPGSLVLRTHTSPVQIRSMLAQGAPIRVVAPGRVYRCDSDPTHSPMFHQIEGLWVDEGVSMAHLRGVLTGFINALFGERGVRLRPSFFPFVEPGVEVDLECVFCDGAGCNVCKQTGWMEILGAGMVHPNVLRACNIDAEKYTGFAFGLGIDRVAMLRWAVDDLAHMFRSDVRFLEQI
ncbi:MAG: phenylalanine--tRNA ligase subunit alpha [Deltaproteobacteria bacterium]|jgi:phenylalanyl-tRNA synthetase alpha chain